MATITAEVIIEAPADAVWRVLAYQVRPRRRVGDCHSSTASAAVAANVGAPVPGRVCADVVRMVPEVEERVVAYDEANRTLTYEAQGVPKFIKTARNRWHVQAVDDRRSHVSFEGTLEPRGLIGRVMYSFLRLQLARLGPQFLNDFSTTSSTASHRPANNANSAPRSADAPWSAPSQCPGHVATPCLAFIA